MAAERPVDKAREERLARALRANLARRKGQAKARAASQERQAEPAHAPGKLRDGAQKPHEPGG